METFAIPHYRCYQSRTQFRTIVNLLKTGKEHRAACWQSPKRAWTLTFKKDPVTTKAILDFHAARQGRFEAFYWMDPKDVLRTVRFDHDDLQAMIGYGGYGEFQVTFAEVVPAELPISIPVEEQYFTIPAHSVYELHQRFNTLITPPEAGFEARLSQWQSGRRSWNLTFEKDPDVVDQLIEFFEARRGQFEAFNWHDPGGFLRRVRFGTDTLDLDIDWGGYGRTQVPLLEVI